MASGTPDSHPGACAADLPAPICNILRLRTSRGLHSDVCTTSPLLGVFLCIPNTHIRHLARSYIPYFSVLVSHSSYRHRQVQKRSLKPGETLVLEIWAGPGPLELQEQNPFLVLLSAGDHQGSLIPNHEVKLFMFFLSLYDPYHVCIIERSLL